MICQHIETAAQQGDLERIKDLYQLMVEQCIEYKLYSSKIQHQYNNNGIKYQSPRFPVLEGYQIVYL